MNATLKSQSGDDCESAGDISSPQEFMESNKAAESQVSEDAKKSNKTKKQNSAPQKKEKKTRLDVATECIEKCKRKLEAKLPFARGSGDSIIRHNIEEIILIGVDGFIRNNRKTENESSEIQD